MERKTSCLLSVLVVICLALTGGMMWMAQKLVTMQDQIEGVVMSAARMEDRQEAMPQILKAHDIAKRGVWQVKAFESPGVYPVGRYLTLRHGTVTEGMPFTDEIGMASMYGTYQPTPGDAVTFKVGWPETWDDDPKRMPVSRFLYTDSIVSVER